MFCIKLIEKMNKKKNQILEIGSIPKMHFHELTNSQIF